MCTPGISSCFIRFINYNYDLNLEEFINRGVGILEYVITLLDVEKGEEVLIGLVLQT